MKKVRLLRRFLLSLIVTLTGFSGPVYSATSKLCPGDEGYYFTNKRQTNPTKGGFVSNGAYVDEYAFVAPTAAICGSASVEGGARIMGNAIIKGEAIIYSNVRVTGNAIVGGNTEVYSDRNNPTLIKGYARIFSGVIEGGRHGSNELPADVVNAQNAKKEKERLLKTMEKIFMIGLNEYELVWDKYDSSDYTKGSIKVYPKFRIYKDCSLYVRMLYDYRFYVARDTLRFRKGWQESNSWTQTVNEVNLKGLKIKINDKGQMLFFDEFGLRNEVVRLESYSALQGYWRKKGYENILDFFYIPKREAQTVNYSERRKFFKAFKKYAETYCEAKVSI